MIPVDDFATSGGDWSNIFFIMCIVTKKSRVWRGRAACPKAAIQALMKMPAFSFTLIPLSPPPPPTLLFVTSKRESRGRETRPI